jgi:lysophospholipase L1-like esterase
MKKLLLLLLVTISSFAQNDFTALKGKRIWYFGDSITMGQDIGGLPYPAYVSYYVNGITMNRAIAGTTMMKQIPIDKLGKFNMETLSETIPIFDATKDGLIFISFLTNDVGLFFPDYTLENYGKAIDYIIPKILNAGWNKDRIKFNVRYFITAKGLDYTTINRLYVPNVATLERYNAFADLLKSKLDAYDIQYFDHWGVLEAVPNAVSYLDAIQIHPNSAMHKIIADNIMKTLYIQKSLSIDSFNKKDVITDLEYFNLLGQKIKQPTAITIVKGKNNGIQFTKKIYSND